MILHRIDQFMVYQMNASMHREEKFILIMLLQQVMGLISRDGWALQNHGLGAGSIPESPLKFKPPPTAQKLSLLFMHGMHDGCRRTKQRNSFFKRATETHCSHPVAGGRHVWWMLMQQEDMETHPILSSSNQTHSSLLVAGGGHVWWMMQQDTERQTQFFLLATKHILLVVGEKAFFFFFFFFL